MVTKKEKAAAKCRKNPPAKKPKKGRKKQNRESHSKAEKKNISKGLKKFNKCVKKKLEKKKKDFTELKKVSKISTHKKQLAKDSDKLEKSKKANLERSKNAKKKMQNRVHIKKNLKVMKDLRASVRSAHFRKKSILPTRKAKIASKKRDMKQYQGSTIQKIFRSKGAEKGGMKAYQVLTNPDLARLIKGFTKKPSRKGKAASWAALKGRLMDDNEDIDDFLYEESRAISEGIYGTWWDSVHSEVGNRRQNLGLDENEDRRERMQQIATDKSWNIVGRARSKAMKAAWKWGKKDKTIREMKDHAVDNWEYSERDSKWL
jgi:hypothetical protein